jgi:cobalt-zinc-cadmium efflux system outer membrane protein
MKSIIPSLSTELQTAVLLSAVMLFAGCVNDTRWGKSRPLGADIPSYEAPENPEAPPVSQEEPSGIINLRRCLALALMQNPEFKVFSWETREAEARAIQEGLIPNPELGIESSEFGGSDERAGFRAAESTLTLSQVIELGGKAGKRKKLADAEIVLKHWDYETKRLAVFVDTTQVFLELIAAQEHLKLSNAIFDTAKNIFRMVEARVESGKANPLDRGRALVALANAKISLEKARIQLEVSRRKLAFSWGSSDALFDNAEGKLDSLQQLPTIEELRTAISENPHIARWAAEVDRNLAAIELERAKRIPDVTLSGGITRFEDKDDYAFSGGLSIPLPLFNRNQGAILEARRALAKARAQEKASEIQVNALLNETYALVANTHNEIVMLKDDVLPSAEASFKAATDGYAVGKFSHLEVLDSQHTFFETRERYLSALCAHQQAVAALEGLAGRSIDSMINNKQGVSNNEKTNE